MQAHENCILVKHHVSRNSFWRHLTHAKLLADTSIHVNNTMGKVGAWFAYNFFHLGTGLAAFLIPFVLFLVGFRFFFSSR